jgi:hypothetical protein
VTDAAGAPPTKSPCAFVLHQAVHDPSCFNRVNLLGRWGI